LIEYGFIPVTPIAEVKLGEKKYFWAMEVTKAALQYLIV